MQFTVSSNTSYIFYPILQYSVMVLGQYLQKLHHVCAGSLSHQQQVVGRPTQPICSYSNETIQNLRNSRETLKCVGCKKNKIK